MFAKVFGQIFDSSIAEDYNCRRMFMDLLVLADSDGVVDMTPEAISRRTNVPLKQVAKYIEQLLQPDPLSRTKDHEGKRLIPIDSGRSWGWQIVNFQLYREIRDEEGRRAYFRDAQRKYRAKKAVKDKSLTGVDKVSRTVDSPSASASASSSVSSSSFLEKLKADPTYIGIDIDRELQQAKNWCQRKNRRLTERFFKNWLAKADRVIAAGASKPKYLPPANEPTEDERQKALALARSEVLKLSQQFKMP